MRKYAFLKNNIVMLIDMIEPDDYSIHIKNWDAIIDIEGLSPEPAVGWIMLGNLLLPTSPDVQQREQQIFGSALAIEMVNKMGSRNLSFAAQGQVVNVAGLLTALGAIKSLMETGALKTARSTMQYYHPSFPAYSDIIQEGIDKITQFLISKGWN